MMRFLSTPTKVRPWLPLHLVGLITMGLFALLTMQDGTFIIDPIFIGLTLSYFSYYSFYLIKVFQMGDPYLYPLVQMLVSLGMVMQYRLSPEIGLKHFAWYLVGLFISFMVYAVYKTHVWKTRPLWICYGAIIGLFLITLLFGTSVHGAKNWIHIKGFSFQPSELIKILFVFFMAQYVSVSEKQGILIFKYKLNRKWVMALLVYLVLGLFVVQKEFGTALLIFMVYLSYLYISESSLKFTLGNILFAGTGAAIAVRFSYHLQVRMDSWLNPWTDLSGKGYQISQSLFAIGSGGLWGTGIGLGHPKYIPAVHTDFIYAAICEEMGILTGIAVVLLFFLLLYRGITIALQLKEPFLKSLAFGLTTTLALQSFIIIGGVIKLIPLTGITLPFISYGGSSFISSYMTLGLLQALSALQAEDLKNDTTTC